MPQHVATCFCERCPFPHHGGVKCEQFAAEQAREARLVDESDEDYLADFNATEARALNDSQRGPE
jgi:hypothetical protein